MSNRMIHLPSRCPECGAHVGVGNRHEPTCCHSYDCARGAADIAAVPGVQSNRMDWTKVRRSLGDCCPRRACGLPMLSYAIEHKTVWRCQCGYYAEEMSVGSRSAFNHAAGIRARGIFGRSE